MNSSGSELDSMVVSCEHCEVHIGSINGKNFFKGMSDY
jgi:hypothetical protein